MTDQDKLQLSASTVVVGRPCDSAVWTALGGVPGGEVRLGLRNLAGKHCWSVHSPPPPAHPVNTHVTEWLANQADTLAGTHAFLVKPPRKSLLIR